MPDGLTRLGSLSKLGPRALAVRTAQSLEAACAPIAIPDIPSPIAHLTADVIRDWRERGTQNGSEAEQLREWGTWSAARSGAIHDNLSRLRGCLWCWRALKAVTEQDPSDTEALSLLFDVREFLAQQWGVSSPPLDRVEAEKMAQRVVRAIDPNQRGVQ